VQHGWHKRYATVGRYQIRIGTKVNEQSDDVTCLKRQAWLAQQIEDDFLQQAIAERAEHIQVSPLIHKIANRLNITDESGPENGLARGRKLGIIRKKRPLSIYHDENLLLICPTTERSITVP